MTELAARTSPTVNHSFLKNIKVSSDEQYQSGVYFLVGALLQCFTSEKMSQIYTSDTGQFLLMRTMKIFLILYISSQLKKQVTCRINILEMNQGIRN